MPSQLDQQAIANRDATALQKINAAAIAYFTARGFDPKNTPAYNDKSNADLSLCISSYGIFTGKYWAADMDRTDGIPRLYTNIPGLQFIAVNIAKIGTSGIDPATGVYTVKNFSDFLMAAKP